MIKFNPFAKISSGKVTPLPTIYSNYGMSISPEKAEEASYKLVATKYVNATDNANVNIGDNVQSVVNKIKKNPALKSDYERYTKFLNTEVQKINKANQAVDQLKKIANDEYSKALDDMNKTGNYDEKKLTSIESSLNNTIKNLMGGFLSDVANSQKSMNGSLVKLDERITKNEMFKSNKFFSNNLKDYLESADKALTNIESFKNSASPITLVANWEKKPNAAYDSKGQKSKNMITRFTLSPEKTVDSSPYISKMSEEADKRAPESQNRLDFLNIIKEHKNIGYGEVPTKKINERLFDNGTKIMMITIGDQGISMIKIDKESGEYEANNIKDGEKKEAGSGKIDDQGFKALVGGNLDLLRNQINRTFIPSKESLDTKTDDAEVKAIEETSNKAPESPSAETTTNYSDQTEYASGQAKSSPSAKAFYRVKNPNGGPDRLYDAVTNKLIADEAEFKTGYNKEIEMPKSAKAFFRVKNPTGGPDRLYDAVTNKLIADEAEFKTGYTKEIEMPKTVKAIYRDGEKIYDYHTDQHITDPAILGSQYKGAIEVAKKKADDDYFNKMKDEISGEKDDGQSDNNVSKGTSVGSEDKKGNTILPTKTEDPTNPSVTTGGSTTNTGTTINPWAANANTPKEKEFIKVDNTDLDKKVMSYKKFVNKEKLSGVE